MILTILSLHNKEGFYQIFDNMLKCSLRIIKMNNYMNNSISNNNNNNFISNHSNINSTMCMTKSFISIRNSYLWNHMRLQVSSFPLVITSISAMGNTWMECTQIKRFMLVLLSLLINNNNKIMDTCQLWMHNRMNNNNSQCIPFQILNKNRKLVIQFL